MPQALSVTEVVRNFADYINRVAYRGESFVLLRGSKPVAELRPLPAGTRLGDMPGIVASLPRLDDARAFASDLDAARAEIAGGELVDPWEF